MCCPVQGFPPPQVSWELPNRTRVETGSTILHVTVKTENDFGRYRCIARSLEKNVLMANITIRKRSKYKLKIQVKFASPSLQGDMTTSEKIINYPAGVTPLFSYVLIEKLGQIFNKQRSLDCALFCCRARRKRLELERSVGRNTRRIVIAFQVDIYANIIGYTLIAISLSRR